VPIGITLMVLVKILMRLPDGNISAARLSVLYKELIRQHDLRLSQRLEITVVVRIYYPTTRLHGF